VRRLAGDDEPDPLQPARLAALFGEDQVAYVDRVERAAEKSQSHGDVKPFQDRDVAAAVDKRAEFRSMLVYYDGDDSRSSV
jgi:hypothetical protein